MKTPPDPLTMGPRLSLSPICLFPYQQYVPQRPPAKPPGLFAQK
jgi:hypothetical protein